MFIPYFMHKFTNKDFKILLNNAQRNIVAKLLV